MKYTVSITALAVTLLVCFVGFGIHPEQSVQAIASVSASTSSTAATSSSSSTPAASTSSTTPPASTSSVSFSKIGSEPNAVTVSSPPALSHSEAIPASEAVDNSYYDDALFVGHSLMEGFRLYSGITTVSSATFCSYTSATVASCLKDSKGTLKSALSSKTYGKIYIMLGINEVGGSAKSFYNNFASLIDLIRGFQPNAEIYLISITPTTKAKVETSFNNQNIKNFNASMLSVAADKNCWYLDLFSYYVGSDGYLPSSDSKDGVHFISSRYSDMLTYLKMHTVTN